MLKLAIPSIAAAIKRNAETLLMSAVSGACAAILIVAAFIIGSGTGWNPAVAAWVQAGAATLAMGVAIGVAAWQSHQNRELLREQAVADLRRRLEALLGLLQAGNHEVWRCRRFLLRYAVGSRHDALNIAAMKLPFDDELARLDGVMGSIVLHELPSWDLAQAVLLARQSLTETRSVGTAILQSMERGNPAPNPLVPQIDQAKRAIELARSTSERLLGTPWPRITTEFPQDPETTPVVIMPDLLPSFEDVQGYGV